MLIKERRSSRAACTQSSDCIDKLYILSLASGNRDNYIPGLHLGGNVQDSAIVRAVFNLEYLLTVFQIVVWFWLRSIFKYFTPIISEVFFDYAIPSFKYNSSTC